MSAAFRQQTGVSDEVYAKMERYHALLLKWQKAINLVSPKTIPEAWARHFLDSAQIAPLIPEKAVVADLGCGAGFPGLVLAIMRPDVSVHLIESDARKGEFMRTVSRETFLENMKLHTKRIEEAYGDVQPTLVTARALAPLSDLLGYVLPWMKGNPALSCVFLKGRNAEGEIAAAQQMYDFHVTRAPSLSDSEGEIVVLRQIKATKGVSND